MQGRQRYEISRDAVHEISPLPTECPLFRIANTVLFPCHRFSPVTPRIYFPACRSPTRKVRRIFIMKLPRVSVARRHGFTCSFWAMAKTIQQKSLNSRHFITETLKNLCLQKREMVEIVWLRCIIPNDAVLSRL